MKANVFYILIFLSSAFCGLSAQDIIIKKSGEDIEAKVLEIKQSEIKYRRFDNLSGPIYIMPKSDIAVIRYENGQNEIFNKNEVATEAIPPKNYEAEVEEEVDMWLEGKRDAQRHYQGQRSGAGWTAATTIILSPILGLAPAIGCSLSEPSEGNLNYPSRKKMQNYDYYISYKKEAHKTKKRKVWTGYGIGSAVWLLIVAVF